MPPFRSVEVTTPRMRTGCFAAASSGFKVWTSAPVVSSLTAALATEQEIKMEQPSETLVSFAKSAHITRIEAFLIYPAGISSRKREGRRRFLPLITVNDLRRLKGPLLVVAAAVGPLVNDGAIGRGYAGDIHRFAAVDRAYAVIAAG